MGRVAIPEVVLNSGWEIPLIGMGTAGLPPSPPRPLPSVYVEAMEMGYRHFDTARIYLTETPLGKAIAEALQRGIIKSRDELFITSKLWCTDAHHDLVLPALKKTLEKLGLEYVDLYLIHWPVRMKQEAFGFDVKKEDLLPFDMTSTWEAMEECQRLRLAKSIGVSNFSYKKLEKLLTRATIPPAVNQVEMNPAWQQKKLREFCKAKGIHVSAYSVLGANGGWWGTLAVMENSVLKEIAQAKGKSIAQIAVRWVYEQGVSVLVKSFNSVRMKENLMIFDWELTKEESHLISQIPQRRGSPGEMFISPDGQYKDLDQLWDGEI